MKTLFSLLLLAFAGSLSATPLPVKIELTGRIVDAEFNAPLEFATVAVLDSNQKLITGASTDSLGIFTLDLAKGAYTLQFEFIGYSSL